MPRIDGIDVARYQLAIDWPSVPASIRWTACKATQGTTYVDPTFATNREGMARSGRHWRLFYHWLTPTATPAAQAAHFLRTVGPLDAGEGLMLDAEEAGITVDGCVRFCEIVEAATGRPVAVYSGVYVARGTLWKSADLFAAHRPRLLAAYASEVVAARIAGPYGWDVWQWSSTQMIPGIAARCDVNQVDRTDRLDAACGYNQPQPAPIPVPVEEFPMLIVVDNKDLDGTAFASYRWVWNGASIHLLENEDEFNRLKAVFVFHPTFASLAGPYRMTTAEIAAYT